MSHYVGAQWQEWVVTKQVFPQKTKLSESPTLQSNCVGWSLQEPEKGNLAMDTSERKQEAGLWGSSVLLSFLDAVTKHLKSNLWKKSTYFISQIEATVHQSREGVVVITGLTIAGALKQLDTLNPQSRSWESSSAGPQLPFSFHFPSVWDPVQGMVPLPFWVGFTSSVYPL